jgi:membrane carboxypeptidase/penicillin-binding protein
MRRPLQWLATFIAVLLIALIAFEAFALWRAKQRTPEVLRAAAEGPLRLSALSAERQQELLAVEDPSFFRHHGVDFSTPGQGLTTITQGLVKILYFDRFTPGFAKIEQRLIARFVLDPSMSKADQLHAFVNHAYFGTYAGRDIQGFEAASEVYFGRSFDRLNNDQYLSLVAMLMAPDRLDPLTHRSANRERVLRIKLMLSGECRPTGLRDVTYEGCAGAAAKVRQHV